MHVPVRAALLPTAASRGCAAATSCCCPCCCSCSSSSCALGLAPRGLRARACVADGSPVVYAHTSCGMQAQAWRRARACMRACQPRSLQGAHMGAGRCGSVPRCAEVGAWQLRMPAMGTQQVPGERRRTSCKYSSSGSAGSSVVVPGGRGSSTPSWGALFCLKRRKYTSPLPAAGIWTGGERVVTRLNAAARWGSSRGAEALTAAGGGRAPPVRAGLLGARGQEGRVLVAAAAAGRHACANGNGFAVQNPP